MEKKLESIDNVADYFIWFANEHGDLITHLKLQKLCFFAEAFYLASKEEPLTGELFEAWAHGPVSRSMWNRFKDFRNMPLNVEKSDLSDSTDTNKLEYHYEEPFLLEKTKRHLKNIIDCFWGKSAWELEYITHTHLPWKKARGDLDTLAPCDRIIDPKDVTEFYKKYIENDAE